VTFAKESSALAQQLLCALDTYEAAFSAWAATPSLLDFRRVETQLARVRVLRMLVPQVAGAMAEIVIAHVDLSTMYVRDRTGIFGKQHSTDELASARQRHSTAIESMRLHCYDLANERRSSSQNVEPVARRTRSKESLALSEVVNQIR
jgi:hypothetical protein